MNKLVRVGGVGGGAAKTGFWAGRLLMPAAKSWQERSEAGAEESI